jgi:putative hemolysin
MSPIFFEILILLSLILINGVFSISEIAVVSARRQRLQHRADAGEARAQVALDLAQNPTRFLSTVQVGITLIGILSGALGGATIAEQLAIVLSRSPRLAPYGEAIGVGIVVIAITYLSLVFGELVPKRIALADAERYAIRMAPLMQTLARLTTPVVHLLTASTEAVYRMLKFPPSQEPAVTEESARDLPGHPAGDIRGGRTGDRRAGLSLGGSQGEQHDDLPHGDHLAGPRGSCGG